MAAFVRIQTENKALNFGELRQMVAEGDLLGIPDEAMILTGNALAMNGNVYSIHVQGHYDACQARSRERVAGLRSVEKVI